MLIGQLLYVLKGARLDLAPVVPFFLTTRVSKPTSGMLLNI